MPSEFIPNIPIIASTKVQVTLENDEIKNQKKPNICIQKISLPVKDDQQQSDLSKSDSFTNSK